MTTYEQYLLALRTLRAVAAKKDFTPEGQAEYQVAYSACKRLYLNVCLEEQLS